MYDIPVADAFELMALQDDRAREHQDEKTRNAGGGLKGFHQRMKKSVFGR